MGYNRDNAVDSRLPMFGLIRLSDVVAVVAVGDPVLEHAGEQVLRLQLPSKALSPS